MVGRELWLRGVLGREYELLWELRVGRLLIEGRLYVDLERYDFGAGAKLLSALLYVFCRGLTAR